MDYYKSLILRILIPFIISYKIIQVLALYLTINISKIVLALFSQDVFVIGTFLSYNENFVKFIPACAAASAYYLLLLLTTLTKDIQFKKRLKIFFYGSLIIFIINILRIVSLILFLDNKSYILFNAAHNFFWSIISSVLVAGIWVYLIRRYKIKSIPIYSDLKYLIKKINLYK